MKIRISEGRLRSIIGEAVRKALDERVSMRHGAHNLDDYLDDADFTEIVDRVVGTYGPEDLDVREVASIINDFVSDEALDDFGYKYGTTDFRRVASNVIRYIRSHSGELYSGV